ncbi:MAG TPA: hypothetical protein VFU27_02150 [Terriglobales bacterium]|nr:hypothetical protein [Terriglobales bacterium]
MKRAWRVLLMVALACSAAGAQTSMKTVVKLVETQYSVRHHGVPLLWLAKPFLLGSGVGGLKMAEFTNLQVPPGQVQTLKQQIGEALGAQWSPFVESWSKDGGWSTIYARAQGRSMRMLMVEEEGGSLSVLQMNLKKAGARGWFDEPAERAREVGGRQR